MAKLLYLTCILFLISFPAIAQENQAPVSPAYGHWKATPPTAAQTTRISPEQPESMKSSATGELREHIAPEQPSFGKNPNLRESAEPDTGTEPETNPNLKADYTELRLANTTAVEQIIDPLRIRLKGGKIVQLAGIDIPGLDPHEPGDVAIAARDFLAGWLVNKQARLYQTKDNGKGRVNRMGYDLGHLEMRDDEIWVQGALLAAGLARVLPTARNPEMAAQMVALEDYARTRKKGMWAVDEFGILTPETARKNVGGWGIVEGTVHSTATIRNMVYINFGPDWRTDFTIGVDSAMRRTLGNAGINALRLGKKRVRVRGWIEDYNGPYIALSHPVWLEILPSEHNASNNN